MTLASLWRLSAFWRSKKHLPSVWNWRSHLFYSACCQVFTCTNKIRSSAMRPHESVKIKKNLNQLELSITNTHVGMANRESKQSHKLSFTMTLISYLQECEGSLCYSGTMWFVDQFFLFLCFCNVEIKNSFRILNLKGIRMWIYAISTDIYNLYGSVFWQTQRVFLLTTV